MKKLLLYILLIFSVQPAMAQFEIAGSKEYGRIFDITYDPVVRNTLYAVTLGNHILISENNGLNWKILYTFPKTSVQVRYLKLLNKTTLSFHVYDPNGMHNRMLYILNINSLALIKSYEIPIAANADKSYISSYGIYEDNTDVAIVQQYYRVGLGFFAKVYYTNDGGATWSEIYYNVNYNYISPINVAISPNNPEKLFIARSGGLDASDYGGLFISNDAGAIWEEKLSGLDFNAIAFRSNDPDTLLIGTSLGSQQQSLFKSTDGGENWNAIDENWGNTLGRAITDIKYNPANPDNVLVLIEDAIVTTSDDFETRQTNIYPNAAANHQAPNAYYYGLNATFNPFEEGEIFISSNYYPLFSNDGGMTVNRIKVPFFSSYEFAGFVRQNDETHLYYDVQNGYIHKNISNSHQTPHFVSSLEWLSNWDTAFFADENQPGRVYLFSGSFMGSVLNMSNDHGETLASAYIPSQYLHAIVSHPGNTNLVWASFSPDFATGELLEINFSNPDDITQTPVTLPETGLVTAIYIDPANTAKKLIALGKKIYYTADSGLNWEERSAGLEILSSPIDQIFQITQNPLNLSQITVATTMGVFTTYNQGSTWMAMNSFPSVRTNLIKHSPVTPGHIIAVSYEYYTGPTAVRYSKDFGVTWNDVPAEDLHYIASNSAAIDFKADKAILYMSTTDIGLIKYKVDLDVLDIPGFETHNSWLKVYPNPSKDYIHLELKGELLERATIFSATGQKVIEDTNLDINIAGLQEGIYFIEVITDSGKKTTKKIIRN